MLYRFRVILDAEDDVFRDIEILSESTLEDLHNAIFQAFGFDGNEMASFYISDDDWNQGEEISQVDMTDGENDLRLMDETTLDDVVSESQTKLIYVYDFLSMWTFLVELEIGRASCREREAIEVVDYTLTAREGAEEVVVGLA